MALMNSVASRTKCTTTLVAKLPRGVTCFSAPIRKQSLHRPAPVTAVRNVKVQAAAAFTEDEEIEEALRLPYGYHWYETMMVFRTTLTDDERDRELAKFEAFLNKQDCMHINALVRPKARMAYPVKGNWEGVYVLYTYAAKRQTARTVQLILSKPEAGSEDNLLRHMTLCRM